MISSMRRFMRSLRKRRVGYLCLRMAPLLLGRLVLSMKTMIFLEPNICQVNFFV